VRLFSVDAVSLWYQNGTQTADLSENKLKKVAQIL